MDFFTQQAVSAFASSGFRLDSNETAFLERELTQLRSKTYDVLYGAYMGRTFAPKATDIAASADKYSYKVYDKIGAARIGDYDSDDAPNIDTFAREETGRVYPVEASYQWNINEMREAIRTRVPLSEKKAQNTRDAIELAIDDMLFQGHPETDAGASSNILTTGLSNNAAVVAQGVAALTDWDGATPVETIQSEIYSMISTVRTNSLQRFNGTTLVLPEDKYSLIAQRNVDSTNQMTILKSILANNPFLTSIEPWYKLNGINRAVLLDKRPLVLEAVLPQEFEQLPPQARNFKFIVPCHARCGGIKVYQPRGMLYGDFA